jgi:hypothetical protein
MLTIKVTSASTLTASKRIIGDGGAHTVRSPPSSAPASPAEQAGTITSTGEKRPPASLSREVVSADHPLIWGSPFAEAPAPAACAYGRTADELDNDELDNDHGNGGKGRKFLLGACATAHQNDGLDASEHHHRPIALPAPVAAPAVRLGSRKRGIRWPARRGASAGLSEHTVPNPLPQPTFAQGTGDAVGGATSAQPAQSGRGRSGLRWPARRGTTSGLAM